MTTEEILQMNKVEEEDERDAAAGASEAAVPPSNPEPKTKFPPLPPDAAGGSVAEVLRATTRGSVSPVQSLRSLRAVNGLASRP